jgi:hypothetical protein
MARHTWWQESRGASSSQVNNARQAVLCVHNLAVARLNSQQGHVTVYLLKKRDTSQFKLPTRCKQAVAGPTHLLQQLERHLFCRPVLQLVCCTVSPIMVVVIVMLVGTVAVAAACRLCVCMSSSRLAGRLLFLHFSLPMLGPCCAAVSAAFHRLHRGQWPSIYSGTPDLLQTAAGLEVD